MFKSKLITNERYFQLRRWSNVLFFFAGILTVNLFQNPFWIACLQVLGFFSYLYIIKKLSKQIEASINSKLIEMDQEEIRILSKNGEVLEHYTMSDIDTLKVYGKFSQGATNLKDLGEQLWGKMQPNYVIVQDTEANTNRKIFFDIDSYYKLNQLTKVFDLWKNQGYNVEKLA